jgi:hypothetical protein
VAIGHDSPIEPQAMLYFHQLACSRRTRSAVRSPPGRQSARRGRSCPRPRDSGVCRAARCDEIGRGAGPWLHLRWRGPARDPR